MAINADAYRQAMRSAFIASNRLPMDLTPIEQDNFLPISAPAMAMCMSGINFAETSRGGDATIFSGYFRPDESNAVSMSGFTVSQMEEQIALSPINTFHLYVRDLQNAISGVVNDATYSDSMVDYFRRTYDYRWRLAATPAAMRISDGVEIPTWSGVKTVDCLTRVSGGLWPFTIPEISGMTSFVGIDIAGTNRTSGLDSFITATEGRDAHGQIIEGIQNQKIEVGNDPITENGGYHQYGQMLAPIWVLQSLIWTPPQTETFYTDQTTATYATSIRSTGTAIDNWLDDNTNGRAFFQAGQFGKWMVIDGKWSASNGVGTVDTAEYSDYPVSGISPVNGNGTSLGQNPNTSGLVGGFSVTFDNSFTLSPTLCWTQLALDNEGGTDVNANNNPNYDQSYDNGIIRFGPGSQLIVNGTINSGSGSDGSGTFSTSNDSLITFTSTNMNTASDGSFNQVDDCFRAVSRSGYETTSSPIDLWSAEAAAPGFTSQTGIVGSTLTSIKIGGDRTYRFNITESQSAGGWTNTTGVFTKGNLQVVEGASAAWPVNFQTAYFNSLVSSLRAGVAGFAPSLETSISEVRITYPYILTTSDPETGYSP